MRGPTYLFLATLKTTEPKHKWTLTGTFFLRWWHLTLFLAGTALMLQTDD